MKKKRAGERARRRGTLTKLHHKFLTIDHAYNKIGRQTGHEMESVMVKMCSQGHQSMVNVMTLGRPEKRDREDSEVEAVETESRKMPVVFSYRL